MSILGLTDQQIEQIGTDFRKIPVPSFLEKVNRNLTDCTVEERLCLMFICAYLPASDMADYPIAYFKKVVRDTLVIRDTLPWKDLYKGDLFLNYILPIRCNNENLTDHRMDFYNEIFPRVENLTQTAAVLEVNYWCYEKATYQSTDFRTASPLTVIRNTYGRCGEESVLCVAALRSIGIPARQCYTPRWAHCDDNHAWVEVFVDGAWHFIGACEPEAQLDKGWFAGAASQAMLIYARVFGHFNGGEAVTLQTPVITQVNIMKNYARTKQLTIQVTDADNQPVPGALVQFEVLNFSQFSPIAQLFADENGKVSLITGCGDLFIHAAKDGVFGDTIAVAAEENTCVKLGYTTKAGHAPVILKMVPPPANVHTSKQTLTPTQQHQHEAQLKNAEEIRKEYQNSFLQGEAANAFAQAFPGYEKQAETFISKANGNHQEISSFLVDKALLADKMDLLGTLRDKDFSDTSSNLLQSCLIQALSYKEQFPREIFVDYVLAPRVAFETLTDYRPFVSGYFSAKEKNAFRKNPAAAWSYLLETVKDCGTWEYETLSASPEGLLNVRFGSMKSMKIAFVSICRSLGIPALLHLADHEPEYWTDGNWHRLAAKAESGYRTGCLTLVKEFSEEELVYNKNFCIEKLGNGMYAPLNLEHIAFSGEKVTYTVEAGEYRVTVSNRLLDGSVDICLHFLQVRPNDEALLEITLPSSTSGSDIICHLTEVPVYLKNGELRNALSFLPENRPGSLAILEVGREPTEHLLNEILEQPEAFRQKNGQLILLVTVPEHNAYPLLKKVMESTGLQILVMNEKILSAADIRKAAHCASEEFPLIIGINNQYDCLFSVAGYHVGTGQLLLNHFKGIL